MASTLSVQDYLRYFLLKPSAFESGDHENEKASALGSLLVATVYKQEKEKGETMIYSKRIHGGKNAEPMSAFLQDMTGCKDKTSNGNFRRMSSTMDLIEEGNKLPRNSTVTIELTSNRSPSNVVAEQLLKLLEYCKRNSIRASLQFNFSHPYSWDNKYNKQGIKQLQEKGIKLKIINFQQAINMMINDVQDNLESLDELQTCRGTLCIDYYMMKRAIAKFRDALLSNDDQYHRETEERLRDMLGQQKPKQIKRQTKKSGLLTNFSLATYRDYFFLQNTEEIWAKLRVCLSKAKRGLTKEELVFDTLYNSNENEIGREKKSKIKEKNPLAENELKKLSEKIWDVIAERITLKELAANDEIIVTLTMIISEYPDRMKWHTTLYDLQRHLAGKLNEAGMKKIRTEAYIRYSMDISCDRSSDNASGRSTPSTLSGQSSKVEADRDHARAIAECMHVQDILFDMLEDLEDGMVKLGRVDYQRGGGLFVDRLCLSAAMGLLNKAIAVRTESGDTYPMNSDFVDPYAETMNQS